MFQEKECVRWDTIEDVMQEVPVDMPDGGENPKLRLLVKYMDDKQFHTNIWIYFEVGRQHGLVLELRNGPNPNFLPLNSSLNLSGFVVVIQSYTEIFRYLCFAPLSLSSTAQDDT